MSSLLQSTGSSPYVLVHIVGSLAATVVVIAIFMVPISIHFFQKFPNFCVQICSLGLRVRFRN